MTRQNDCGQMKAVFRIKNFAIVHHPASLSYRRQLIDVNFNNVKTLPLLLFTQCSDMKETIV